jgi:hypothetical protein
MKRKAISKVSKSKKRKLTKTRIVSIKASPVINLAIGDMFISKIKDGYSRLCFEFKRAENDFFVFFCTQHELDVATIMQYANIKLKHKVIHNDGYYCLVLYLSFSEIHKVLKKIEIEQVDLNFGTNRWGEK